MADASQPVTPRIVSNVGRAVQGLQGIGTGCQPTASETGKPSKQAPTEAVPVVRLIVFGKPFFGNCASSVGGTGLLALPNTCASTTAHINRTVRTSQQAAVHSPSIGRQYTCVRFLS